MKRVLMISAITLSLGLIGVGSSHAATITTYLSQSTWEAAAGTPIAVEDFADTTLVTGFSTTSGSISGGVFNGFAPCILCTATPPALNFSPGTLAFGADFDLTPGGSGAGIVFTAVFADLTEQGIGFITNPSATVQFNGFFGFGSNVAVSSIKYSSGLTGSGESFSMDNARIQGLTGTGNEGGNGGAVPEPSSLLLLGSAVAGLGLWRKFKARS